MRRKRASQANSCWPLPALGRRVSLGGPPGPAGRGSLPPPLPQRLPPPPAVVVTWPQVSRSGICPLAGGDPQQAAPCFCVPRAQHRRRHVVGAAPCLLQSLKKKKKKKRRALTVRWLNIDICSVPQLEYTPSPRGRALVCVLSHKTTGKPEVTGDPWASSLHQGLGDKGTRRMRVPKAYLLSAPWADSLGNREPRSWPPPGTHRQR